MSRGSPGTSSQLEDMRHTTPAVGSDATRAQSHRPQSWLDWAGPLARAGLAVIWIWAGLAKLTDPNGAVLSVRAYRLLPEVLVRPVAWGLPYLELALAVLLLAGIANRIAGAASAGLLVVFMLGSPRPGRVAYRSTAAASAPVARTPRRAPPAILGSCSATVGCWSAPTWSGAPQSRLALAREPDQNTGMGDR